MKIRILLFLSCVFQVPFQTIGQTFTQLDSLRGGWHPNRSCYDLTHYHLRVKPDPVTRYLSGVNRLSCIGITESRTLQVDLDPAFEITQISSSKGPTRWNRTGTSVVVTFQKPIEPGEPFWLEVQYQGHPHPASNPPWDGGFVWQTDANGIPWIGVACEGEGASLWFPCKDHPADEPDSVLLEYEVPRNLVAVGNGRFLGKKAVSDSTYLYRFATRNPINHYNITFNAGDFRTWTDTLRLPDSGKILDLSFFALAEDLPKARKQWTQSKQILKEYSSLFGDYPFIRDGYKLVQTPYLGMEHQSCIAYGDKFEDNEFGFDFILLHETGHEWWGNLLSADDHADMWIHEAFCTYSEALILEKRFGFARSVAYLMTQKKKIKNKTPVAGPREVGFNEWKDSDMYYKGSWMLHSLRYVLNQDDKWEKMLHDLPRAFEGKPVSGRKLVDWISEKAGKNLVPFFRQYLEKTNGPVLEYRIKKAEGGKILSFHWAVDDTLFHYPVPVRINGKSIRLEATAQWKEISIPESTVYLQADEENFLYLLKEKKD